MESKWSYHRILGIMYGQLPIGWIAFFITWGCQLWYYMEVIGTTFLDNDSLLQPDIGGGFDFLWVAIKSTHADVGSSGCIWY